MSPIGEANRTDAEVDAARALGVDLVAGDHDRLIAESCRRLDFDPMTVLTWGPAELHAVNAMNHELVDEMERSLRQHAALLDAMRVRGCATVADLPVGVVVLVLDCSPAVVRERLAALMAPWWGDGADG